MSKFSLFISVALLLASFSAYVFGETDPYAWNGISKNRRYLTNSDFEVVHIPKFRAAERKDRGRSKYGGRRLRCSIINLLYFLGARAKSARWFPIPAYSQVQAQYQVKYLTCIPTSAIANNTTAFRVTVGNNLLHPTASPTTAFGIQFLCLASPLRN